MSIRLGHAVSSLAMFLYLLLSSTLVGATCTANSSTTADLQSALQQGGQNYILSLCQSQIYNITDILNYTAAGQEISTEGYPTDDTRATLVVSGFNISTAVQGQNTGLDNCKLRNVQIDGNRAGAPIYQGGGGLIEMGGATSGQLVEFVHPYDPRGWSCLHIAEGPFLCSNVTIQNNDVGPCGSESFQEWSDGISLSCQSSLVQNNVITDATDGGIVIFESPYSTVTNNTIRVETRTTLGGINMVDVVPWETYGNYTGVHVHNNHIHGGFATSYGNSSLGPNNASAVIKIGIAIGPRTWFDDQFGSNVSFGAVVEDNTLTGAFSFGMAVSSAKDFVITNNSFVGNTSFVGSYGVNCTQGAETPNPPVALLVDPNTTSNLTIQPGEGGFAFISGNGIGMTCFVHPNTTESVWPYGDGGVNSAAVESSSGGSGSGSGTSGGSGSTPSGKSGAPQHIASPFTSFLPYGIATIFVLLPLLDALSG